MEIKTEKEVIKVFFNEIETHIILYKTICFGKNVETHLYENRNKRYVKITK